MRCHGRRRGHVCLRCPACDCACNGRQARGVPKMYRNPSRAHQVGNSTCHFCRSFANRPSKGTGVKACHIPRRLSASNAHHSRAHLPKRRRNDRESPRDRASFTPSPFFMLLCVRAPSAPRARLVRLREHVPMPGCVKAPLCPMLQGLSMLRAASQVLKPREFVRKMHCPFLPKSEVRAAVV